MPIFKKTKKETKEKVEKTDVVKAENKTVAKHSVLKKPRITEKAGLLSTNGVYTFDVETNTNACEVAKAIRATYKVTPVKVSITKVPSKSVFVRGKKGVVSGGKKAYVYLKKGDKIEFI